MIRVGDSRSLGQITLAVGGQTEQVVVALQPDMVPLNSGEKSATLTSDQIENIPIVGRSATELSEDSARPHARAPWAHRIARATPAR